MRWQCKLRAHRQTQIRFIVSKQIFICHLHSVGKIIFGIARKHKFAINSLYFFLFCLHSIHQYELRLAASDNLKENYTTVVIHVKDVNDNPPVFERPTYRTQITEEDDRNLPKRVLQVFSHSNHVFALFYIPVDDLAPAVCVFKSFLPSCLLSSSTSRRIFVYPLPMLEKCFFNVCSLKYYLHKQWENACFHYIWNSEPRNTSIRKNPALTRN